MYLCDAKIKRITCGGQLKSGKVMQMKTYRQAGRFLLCLLPVFVFTMAYFPDQALFLLREENFAVKTMPVKERASMTNR